ncbi:Cold-shock protein, DNA-binding domain protein [Candidatus Magnetomorum sp. HK-1]|nr:Cold-shock protein, DNA-binding domain protein [Candidatus Magnetomorum sp. HK-1]
MKLLCQHHKNSGLKPVMIHFGESPLGNKQFVCARCSRIREIGVGHISKLKGNYGFIKNNKKDFFFHFQNAAPDLNPFEGKHVKFEVEFRDNRIEAINVTDIFNKSKGGIS